MLTAKFNSSININLESQEQTYRTASPCWHLDTVQPKKPENLAIIGAGIAGCATAEALARKGIKSTLIDASSDIACGASGNPQAALYARLSPDSGDLEDFCLHALNYARSYYTKHLISTNQGDLTGLIQLPKSEKERSKMEKTAKRFSDAPELISFLDKTELSLKSGIDINSDGLWFPNSGWINGRVFNQHLFKQSDASFIPNTTVTAIKEQHGQFLLESHNEKIGIYDAVILCTAMDTLFYEPANWLPVKPIRGQISFLKEQPETRGLKTVLCRETYLTPPYQGRQSVGATYELNTDNATLKTEDHQTNLYELQKLLDREQALNIEAQSLEGRAGTRTTTPDYLPMVGCLPSLSEFETQYSDWRKDRRKPISTTHNSHSRLYLNLGYGSRGYVYAPLCAEMLANRIAREPEPISIEMQRALHPARFLVRSLSRNRALAGRG